MKTQRGATLIVVLMILLIVTIVGALAIRIAVSSLAISTNSQINQLLVQSSDTPLNAVVNFDMSQIYNLDNVFGATLADTAGVEHIFCYKPTSALPFARSIYQSVIQAGTANAATLVDDSTAGFCQLSSASDYGSGRQAVMTQVAVTAPTDTTTNTSPGSNLPEGTDASEGGSTKNVVQVRKIRVTATSMIPSLGSTSSSTIQNNCLGGTPATGIRISDNNDPSLTSKETLGDCLAKNGVPTEIQSQEFKLKTVYTQILAP